MKYAAERGLAVVVMEPLLGGVLAVPPDPIRKLWTRASRNRTPADGALQWLWDKPEVSVVLSGMTTLQQVQQNVKSACHSGVHRLTEEDYALIENIRKAYHGLQPIPCTNWGYCVPCPHGVDIPLNFQIFNNGVQFTQLARARKNYVRHIPEKARAALCIQCRECEEKCPQQIGISDWMSRVHQELSVKT